MSFWQIFERIQRIARTGADDLFGDSRGYDDELRRAQELIDGERRREEQERDAKHNKQKATAPPEDKGGMSVELASRILRVSTTATLREITVAYRKLVVEVHPDRHARHGVDGQKHAVARTQELNEAYAFLKRHHSG